MKVFNGIDKYIPVDNPVVTIGTFDGVHLGHYHIISKLISEAHKINGNGLIITFWPHPRFIVTSDKNNTTTSLLNTLDEKIGIFEKLGVDNLLIIPFTENFSLLKPQVFINEIIIDLIGTKVLVIGYDHRFGHNRLGSFSFLKENETGGQYKVIEVPAYEINGTAVSSTKIRRALESGEVDFANTMLGYNYSVKGTVVQGLKIGESIGFPTANIKIDDENKLLPKDGVYICNIEVKGEKYPGMLNIGFNPTVSGKGWSFEVHIFGFNKNIYHEKARVEFIQRIRNEMKFENLDELKKQIQKDKEYTLKVIS